MILLIVLVIIVSVVFVCFILASSFKNTSDEVIKGGMPTAAYAESVIAASNAKSNDLFVADVINVISETVSNKAQTDLKDKLLGIASTLDLVNPRSIYTNIDPITTVATDAQNFILKITTDTITAAGLNMKPENVDKIRFWMVTGISEALSHMFFIKNKHITVVNILGNGANNIGFSIKCDNDTSFSTNKVLRVHRHVVASGLEYEELNEQIRVNSIAIRELSQKTPYFPTIYNGSFEENVVDPKLAVPGQPESNSPEKRRSLHVGVSWWITDIIPETKLSTFKSSNGVNYEMLAKYATAMYGLMKSLHNVKLNYYDWKINNTGYDSTKNEFVLLDFDVQTNSCVKGVKYKYIRTHNINKIPHVFVCEKSFETAEGQTITYPILRTFDKYHNFTSLYILVKDITSIIHLISTQPSATDNTNEPNESNESTDKPNESTATSTSASNDANDFKLYNEYIHQPMEYDYIVETLKSLSHNNPIFDTILKDLEVSVNAAGLAEAQDKAYFQSKK